MTRQSTKLVREGDYAVEVPVELIEHETPWSPYLSLEDVEELDAVRIALRRGDIAEARSTGKSSSCDQWRPSSLSR
jgi:hypothetical protein